MVRKYEAIVVDDQDGKHLDREDIIKKLKIFVPMLGASILIFALGAATGSAFLLVLSVGMFLVGARYSGKFLTAYQHLSNHQKFLDKEAAIRERGAAQAEATAASMASAHSPVTPATSDLSELDRLGLTGKRPQ
jgi:hypothetical protein